MALNLNLTKDMAVVLENPWTAEQDAELAEQVWNTGCAAVGEAHCNESELTRSGNTSETTQSDIAAYEAINGVATVLDKDEYNEKKHVAAVRLYKNNEYIYLAPGDKVTLVVGTAEAAAYYAQIPQSEILKVTVEGAQVEETEDEVVEDPAEVTDGE